MSKYQAALAHYAGFSRHFDGCRSDEWAISAYAWCTPESGISLTPIEQLVWDEIRYSNVVMYPQYPVGRYFVDFGNPAAKVAIECDGAEFHLDKAKDAARQRAIEAMGWKVYRITGADCWAEAIEEYDEDGGVVCSLSPVQRFIDAICEEHAVKRGCLGHRSDGPVRLSDLLVQAFTKWIDRSGHA